MPMYGLIKGLPHTWENSAFNDRKQIGGGIHF